MEETIRNPLTHDMVAYRKKYYEENKEKYKEYVTCDICGGKYQLFNKSHHKVLKKHINAVEKQEKEKILAEQQKILAELDALKKTVEQLRSK
jgi:hypothetical protein